MAANCPSSECARNMVLKQGLVSRKQREGQHSSLLKYTQAKRHSDMCCLSSYHCVVRVQQVQWSASAPCHASEAAPWSASDRAPCGRCCFAWVLNCLLGHCPRVAACMLPSCSPVHCPWSQGFAAAGCTEPAALRSDLCACACHVWKACGDHDGQSLRCRPEHLQKPGTAVPPAHTESLLAVMLALKHELSMQTTCIDPKRFAGN